MSDRDLDITKFSYNSYRKLKKTLGEFDAVVECNEIAIREFIEKAEEVNPEEYIQQLSRKHKIKVDEVDFIKFSSRIRQYYVASVFQQSLQFLQDFKKEWKGYFPENEWSVKKENETNLQDILNNVSTNISDDVINIYEYYRLVRNYMAHTDRDIKELESRLTKIKNNSNESLKQLHISILPNSLEDIKFEDFLLITNIVKHIAFVICNNSKPDNTKIAEILLQLSKENDGRAYKGLKKLMNNSSRYQKALESFLCTSFGRFSSEDTKEVTKEFKRLLA